MPRLATSRHSPWPHRLAVALVCATFPLVWIGGLVTTHEAGMAVPDWPNTYGYNLFLYPWTEWVLGPWDLFIEHGHRLLAATVGLLCIAFVITVWRFEKRRWMRIAAFLALALVIGQGVLGGMRVLFDARTMAMIHGCVGPLFFTYCVLLATLTSQRWMDAAEVRPMSRAHKMAPIAITSALVAYAQLVLGAQLRHVGASVTPAMFRMFVVFHLIGATVLMCLVFALAVRAYIAGRDAGWLRRPATFLSVLLLAQIALGACTWVLNYGWPAWFGDEPWAAHVLVNSEGALTAQGSLRANITTAHVAIGSLIVAVSAMIALRTLRVCYAGSPEPVRSLIESGIAA